MEEASASADGDLGRTPFAHLLVYALERRLTGALYVALPSGDEDSVQLIRGAPVKVRAGDRRALLGNMLVAAGAIDAATLDAALRTTGGLLGDILVLSGRVERDVLESVARQQFIRRIVSLFALPPETRFRYVDGSSDLADYGGDPATVDPMETLWLGIRAHGEASSKFADMLARVGSLPLKLHPQNTLARFGAAQAESEILEILQEHPATLDELIVLELGDPDLVRRLVYALLITRQLDLGMGTTPLGSLDSVRPSAMHESEAHSAPVAPGPAPAPATAVARLRLRSTVHRVGAAAPDQPGDGERGGERRRTLTSPVGLRLSPVEGAPGDGSANSAFDAEGPPVPASALEAAPQTSKDENKLVKH